MALNPTFRDGGNINPSNPQNDAHARTFHNHNTFPMSYEHYLTARFGDITPFYVFESEPLDKVPFSSFHELRTHTLSSVFLSKIRMMKDYFAVPYKAIMPNTWDLFYVPPTQGDDVPDDVQPTLKAWTVRLGALLDYVSRFDTQTPTHEKFNAFLRTFFLLESIFSDGSLFSLLGCKLSKYFSFDGNRSFEAFSNAFLSTLYSFIADETYSSLIVYNSEDDIVFNVGDDYIGVSSSPRIWFRNFLEILRTNSDFRVSFDDYSDVQDSFGSIFSRVSLTNIFGDNAPKINISRIVAYQLACHHFMTNDKVDFIYSADLYRNMMYGLAIASNGSGVTIPNSELSFDYNGNTFYYDVFSEHFLTRALNGLVESASGKIDADFCPAYTYFMEIFSFRKSLKYGDYFTGARPTPYASVDMIAPVIGNGVSAIDMTKNQLAQRFANAVNKTGRKLSDYMKGIRGANTMPVLTDPKFLARDVVTIGTQEVENTANDQGNIVSLLRSEQSKYAFEAEIQDPCIFIGVISFDVPRLYSETIERQWFIKDRYDMFNPYFQNIGDQELYKAEKTKGNLTPFAYHLRHMEFKQRYNQVSGGFIDYLKSWSFIADNKDGEDRKYEFLSPDFIRSHNTEFDRFYESLTGYGGLCDYFHFIFKFVNESSPNRNMEYSPTIL